MKNQNNNTQSATVIRKARIPASLHEARTKVPVILDHTFPSTPTPTVTDLLNEIAATTKNTFTTTQNGAIARSTTGNPLLDFFSQLGALRNVTDEQIIARFSNSFLYDTKNTMRALFYARDIRGGLGERRLFRVIARYLANTHPRLMRAYIHHIPHYGRWDDLYTFFDTPIMADAVSLIREQWDKDVDAHNRGDTHSISLMAKWLKSENASSKETAHLARLTRQALGITARDYRVTLAALRADIRIVEADMSAQRWSSISYPAIPSCAATRYRKAFRRHDEDRYTEYLEEVRSGKSKINASVSYPYELIRPYAITTGYGGRLDETLEAQWKALPNYLPSEDVSMLVMADVSGSMTGYNCVPLCTSIGLAIYFAERAKGSFHSKFLTFSEKPKLVTLPEGDEYTLLDKINAIYRAGIGYNTNLEAAFEVVLNSAVRMKAPQSAMPKAIVVISDMEIDQADCADGVDFTTMMAKKYKAAGYTMPKVVYWNVASQEQLVHADAENPYVQFVSGQSPSVFKAVCKGTELGPVELMMEVLGKYEIE